MPGLQLTRQCVKPSIIMSSHQIVVLQQELERQKERERVEKSSRKVTASVEDPGELLEGESASNVVVLRHGSTDESVDETQLLEECYPDTPEPARGKNKRSKE